MSYAPTNPTSSSHKNIIYILIGLIVATLIYKSYSTKNIHQTPSQAQKAATLTTQASKWKASTDSFAKANSKSNVVNFDPKNPFMGPIKNGIMIDGSKNY